jgi:hypothetical protein
MRSYAPRTLGNSNVGNQDHRVEQGHRDVGTTHPRGTAPHRRRRTSLAFLPSAAAGHVLSAGRPAGSLLILVHMPSGTAPACMFERRGVVAAARM